MSAVTRMDPERTAIQDGPAEDEFLKLDDLVTVRKETARRSLDRSVAELEILIREKKWLDVIALFHPVEEKAPELVEHGLQNRVKEKLAFAFGQLGRFDEAIAELAACIEADPDNFYLRNSMAYTAYNSLYAAKNRETFLSGKSRVERVHLAHRHFTAAQRLRPDGVTNFYRQGMLYKQLEGKTAKALPLFEKAIRNWENLEPAGRDAHHQERKNYIKALFNGASAALDIGKVQAALGMMEKCVAEDEKTEYISLVFKYFGLGKVYYQTGSYQEARDALLFAARCRTSLPADFVSELLARTYLMLDNSEKAGDVIARIPAKRKTPYICWTEADILVSLGDYAGARRVLGKSKERDSRSKHKTLIRLAKLEYALGHFDLTRKFAREAAGFYEKRWGNLFADGLFWHALGAYRLGFTDEARKLVHELGEVFQDYPNLAQLRRKLGQLGSLE